MTGKMKKVVEASNPLSNRKFFICAFTLLCGLSMVFFDGLSAAEWVEYSKWIVSIYVGGNVVEKVFAKKITKGE